MNQIRPLAICVFRNNDRILVFEGYDPIKQETFYRPLGGGIEFGEKAENTVRRELMEEINVEVGEVRYLGTLENIFTFNGTPGHEIVLIFDGALEMSGLYEQAVIVGEEAHGAVIRAVWKSLDEFGEGKSILYPDGLLNFLLDSLKEFMRERQVLLPRQFEQIMCAAPPPSELLSACAKLRMLAPAARHYAYAASVSFRCHHLHCPTSHRLRFCCNRQVLCYSSNARKPACPTIN